MANLNINLLPENLAGDSKTGKLKSRLNRVIVIFSVVFVFTTLVLSIVLLLFSLQLRNTEQERVQNEVLVKAYQDTEQDLFFIQDRLVKVKTVQAADTLVKSVEKFNTILDTLPAGALVRDADVNTVNISAVVEIPDPTNLAAFLGQIVTQDFKRVYLKDFSFSPQTGYILTMVFEVQ